MKKRFLFCVIILIPLLLRNTHSGTREDTTVTRIPVWVFLETMPCATNENARASLPPRRALTEYSAFLLSGLLFGCEFTYVPLDKTRAVDEYFEIKPHYEIAASDAALRITDLTPQYPYLYCYAEYTASDILAKRQIAWQSISYRTIQGSGTGERSDEIAGVYTAYINAAKDAVRRYARSVTKNKPREIHGQLLIRDNPRLFMKSGLFHANLEMYIYVEKIIPYTVF